jgi:hypothetical protein
MMNAAIVCTAVVALQLGMVAVGCGSGGATQEAYPRGARAAFVDRCLETMSGSSGPAAKFCNCFYNGLRERLSYSDYKRAVGPIFEAGDLPEELEDARHDVDVVCERVAPGGQDDGLAP